MPSFLRIIQVSLLLQIEIKMYNEYPFFLILQVYNAIILCASQFNISYTMQQITNTSYICKEISWHSQTDL